jgi:hypothetical protein
MLNKEYEFFRQGLLKTVKIREHAYDLMEFTITQKVTDETGKVLIDSGHTSFFSKEEFNQFFTPIVNDLKVIIENDNTNQTE